VSPIETIDKALKLIAMILTIGKAPLPHLHKSQVIETINKALKLNAPIKTITNPPTVPILTVCGHLRY
jgi:hypothetical protein